MFWFLDTKAEDLLAKTEDLLCAGLFVEHPKLRLKGTSTCPLVLSFMLEPVNLKIS